MVPPLMHKSRHDSQPKVTIYLTLVFELHKDMEHYTYSIDRCYTSLAQANDRLGLLSRCNTNPLTRETLRAGENQDTGCQWCTWTRPDADANDFRFHAEVKRQVMHGAIRRDGPSEEDVAKYAGGLGSTAEYRYAFEHKKDLANHVWAVALHCPDRSIAVNDEGRPVELPWVLEGVHEASGNAMARGKRLWREKLAQKQGGFDRLDSHYGFARYMLVPRAANAPTAASKRMSIGSGQQLPPSEATAQIRVERIKVMPQGEMVAMFAPAEAILFNKPFQPLCEGREIERAREATAKVQADLLDLFSAAGESVEDPEMVVADPRTLTPSPIRKRSLRSPQEREQGFRPGVVQEYAQLAATLREPVGLGLASRAQKARNRLSVGMGVASAKKHFYHSMVGENSKSRLLESSFDRNGSPFPFARKEKEKNRRSFSGFPTAVVPPIRLARLLWRRSRLFFWRVA